MPRFRSCFESAEKDGYWPAVYECACMVQCVALLVVAAAELVLTMTTHSLTLRYCMFHSVVLCFLSISYFLCAFVGRTEKDNVRWLHVSGARLFCVLQAIIYVAAIGFSFEDAMHAVSMLIHRHDIGIHYDSMLIAIVGVDFCIKFMNWTILLLASHILAVATSPLNPHNGDYTHMPRIVSLLWHVIPAAPILAIALINVYEVQDHDDKHANSTALPGEDYHSTMRDHSHHNFALLLDPSIAIINAILIGAIVLIYPLRHIIPILLLAVPDDFNGTELETELSEFDAQLHCVHAYKEDSNDSVFSAHYTASSGNIRYTSDHMVAHLRKKGYHRIILQPEARVDGTDACQFTCDDELCAIRSCCDRTPTTHEIISRL